MQICGLRQWPLLARLLEDVLPEKGHFLRLAGTIELDEVGQGTNRRVPGKLAQVVVEIGLEFVEQDLEHQLLFANLLEGRYHHGIDDLGAQATHYLDAALRD